MSLVASVLLLWLLLAVLAGELAHRDMQRRETRVTTPALTEAQRADEAAYLESRIPRDLLHAMTLHNYKAVQDFVDEPGQLVLADAEGNTSLHLAVRRQFPLLVRLLLAYGADPYLANGAGKQPVQLNGHIGRHSYQWTSSQREIIGAFVDNHEREADLDPVYQAQLRFFLAVGLSDVEGAQAAVRDGADPAAARTPMQRTVLHGVNPQMVAVLVSMGAPLDATDAWGRTPLRLALSEGRYQLSRALLEAGAGLDVAEKSSDLSVVLGSRDPAAVQLVELLLDAGASLGRQEWLAALGSRNPDTVRLLLRREDGFDPTTDAGQERMDQAIALGGEQVMAELRRYPAIDEYLVALESDREAAVEGFGKWLAPFFTALFSLITTFACLSAASALLLRRQRLLPYLFLAGISTVVMTHLFVFTRSILSGLEATRLIETPMSEFSPILMAIVDGLALVQGLLVATALWWLAALMRQPRMFILVGSAAHVVVLIVLALHNLGTVGWPAMAYRSLAGWDDRMAELQTSFEADQQRSAERRGRYGRLMKSELPPEEDPPHQALFKAIAERDLAALDALLADGESANARREGGDTLLHAATQKRDGEVIALLLAAGADPNLADPEGSRPVHVLFQNKNDRERSTVLRALVAAGADLDAIDASGTSALCLAAAFRDEPAARRAVGLLLNSGARIRTGDDCAPVAEAHLDLVRWLVARGADVNARSPYLEDDHGRQLASGLWQAARAGKVERVALLLELGADVTQRDSRFGLTPLQTVLDNDRLQGDDARSILELLLANGADPDAIAWDGRTRQDLDRRLRLDSLMAAR